MSEADPPTMTEDPADDAPAVPEQKAIKLPDGIVIAEQGPIVIVGPNGSGKTRLSREITCDAGDVEVVSALRNTKIAQELQPMSLQNSRRQYKKQKDQAKKQAYELSNDFDFMLTTLIGEASEVSLAYLSESRKGDEPDLPPLTTLEEIQALWGKFFPGRELTFKEYLPQVTNLNGPEGQGITYSAWQMSDGEKAALYLAGRALTADENAVLVIDEPETHLHSLLAVQLWDAIEEARPGLRLIYATHDMTFAASRESAQYLLANPEQGLSQIQLAEDVGELAAIMLGAATLSFYAKKVVFCEGESDGLDHKFYAAWNNSNDTVVQAVGGSDLVIRSVQSLAASNIVTNLEVGGVVDRDFRSEAHLGSMPEGILVLGVHEVETLICHPAVVQLVAAHLGVETFDIDDYRQMIADQYSDADRHKVALERWKVRVEAEMVGLVASVTTKDTGLDEIVATLPQTFDQAQWGFLPAEMLAEEKKRVEDAFADEVLEVEAILRLMPGKQLRPLAASALGVQYAVLEGLVIRALKGVDAKLEPLGVALRSVLEPYLS